MELQSRRGVLSYGVLQVSETYAGRVDDLDVLMIAFKWPFCASDVTVRWLEPAENPRLQTYGWERTGDENVTVKHAVGSDVFTSNGRLIWSYKGRRGTQTTTTLLDEEGNVRNIAMTDGWIKRARWGTKVTITFSAPTPDVPAQDSRFLLEYNVPLDDDMTWHFRHTLQLGETGEEPAMLFSELVLKPIDLQFDDLPGKDVKFDKVTLEETGPSRRMEETCTTGPSTLVREEAVPGRLESRRSGTAFSSMHVLEDLTGFPPRRTTTVHGVSKRPIELRKYIVFRSPQEPGGVVAGHAFGYIKLGKDALGVLTTEASLLPAISPGVLTVKEGTHTIASGNATSATSNISIGTISTITVHNVVTSRTEVKSGALSAEPRVTYNNEMTAKNSAGHDQVLSVLIILRGLRKVTAWLDADDPDKKTEFMPQESAPGMLLLDVDLKANSTTKIKYSAHK